MFGRVGKELGPAMNWNKFNPYQTGAGTGDAARQEAIDASYGQATSRLDPRFAKAKADTATQLRNQGLKPGDEAYDRAMGELGEQETDAYNQAMFSSIREGGLEGSRVHGMNLANAGFGNTVRQSQIAEEMQRRGFSLNEINALISGQQVGMPSMPGFSQAGRSQGVDYTGAAQAGYDASMDKYNAGQAGWNSLMSGLGTGAMAFSDIRLKRGIEYVGRILGRSIYRWVYLWGEPGIGVMAHENPDMVVGRVNGYAVVDYRRF
jgi:hypothetical protein